MNRIIISLLSVTVLLLAGCEEEEYRVNFSHYLHVTENEMECADCHGETDEPTFLDVTHETCAVCHDEVEADEIRMDTCGYCHQKDLLPDLDEWQAKPGRQRNIFVHTEALTDRCFACHAPIMDEELVAAPAMKRGEIIRIRDEAHASGEDCLTCHVDMDRYQAPPNHDLAWTKRHGPLGIQTDAACSVCHSDDSCRECHSVMQPVSHNNLWRLRTHGIEAAWDRASCMVCHEEDSCTSCHSQVTPRSHRGAWDDRHCTQCHLAESESCAVCHEGGNSVELHQDYWPSYHDGFNNQTDCWQCHN